MKSIHFLLVIAICLLSCATRTQQQTYYEQQTPYLYVINNGQIDLEINGIFIPAKTDNNPLSVPIIKKKLIIGIPNNSYETHSIKITEENEEKQIKIGGYFDPKNNHYFVSVLLTNNIPLLFAFKQHAIAQKL